MVPGVAGTHLVLLVLLLVIILDITLNALQFRRMGSHAFHLAGFNLKVSSRSPLFSCAYFSFLFHLFPILVSPAGIAPSENLACKSYSDQKMGKLSPRSLSVPGRTRASAGQHSFGFSLSNV